STSTKPCSIKLSASRREQRPRCAINFESLTVSSLIVSATVCPNPSEARPWERRHLCLLAWSKTHRFRQANQSTSAGKDACAPRAKSSPPKLSPSSQPNNRHPLH